MRKGSRFYIQCRKALITTRRHFRSAEVRYFEGIKLRGFRKNRQIKSRRKICNCGPSAKLYPHEK